MLTKLFTLCVISSKAFAFTFHTNAFLTTTRSKATMFMSNDNALAYEALRKFIPNADKAIFRPTSGGVNNVVQYVDTPSGEKYVLRIYNNGFNSLRVNFEMEILKQLRDMKLSFLIPTTIKSMEDENISQVKLSNGAEAALFCLIPGTLPKLSLVKAIGRASGELNAALENVKVDMPSPNPPYYDIYAVHHAVTREKFFQEISSPAFDSCKPAMVYIVEQLVELEKNIVKYHALNLPQQLIHGDLHYDNVLCTAEGVSGLLDFEFCALDWRAMELAVCLSKYAGEKIAMVYFEDFVSGFAVHGKLTKTEIEAIPDLIALRVLSNVVYFVGRAIAKEDSIDSLTTRAESYANRVRWIFNNRQAIVDMITTKMAVKDASLLNA